MEKILTPEHIVIFFAYYSFAAAVGALESPDQSSSKFYRWAFKFLNTMAANLTRAFGDRVNNSIGAPPQPPKEN